MHLKKLAIWTIQFNSSWEFSNYHLERDCGSSKAGAEAEAEAVEKADLPRITKTSDRSDNQMLRIKIVKKNGFSG